MASVYRRPNSPFLYIKYRDELGRLRQHSTGLRHGISAHAKKAKILLGEKRLVEARFVKGSPGEVWSSWVVQYLSRRTGVSPKTTARYLGCWRVLETFLTSKNVNQPRQLTYQHCVEYMEWRKTGDPSNGVLRCSSNTARLDLKILHLICNEALKRDFLVKNPCANLGIKKTIPTPKPELTDEDIALIRKELVSQKMPAWMNNSFEIALHQGCRLMETSIPFSKIDFARKTIEFHAKGNRHFTAPIHPGLLPMLRKWKKTGNSRTCDIPELPSKAWWRFFKAIGLSKKGVCFHCTRVTAITRLIRAGVSEGKVMKIVHHSSTEVNRVYQRIQLADVEGAIALLKV